MVLGQWSNTADNAFAGGANTGWFKSTNCKNGGSTVLFSKFSKMQDYYWHIKVLTVSRTDGTDEYEFIASAVTTG